MDKEHLDEASTTKYPLSNERASTPTEPSPRANTASSSSSLPQTSPPFPVSDTFLRFPRPQGSTDLANWISNSDPNIMRHTPSIENSGLSDSTYELINEDVDIESQDGYHTESMTASVCSLDDTGRADDVHSLAGTERTVDTESAVDETEQMPRSTIILESESQPRDEQEIREEEQEHIVFSALRSDTRFHDDAASQASMEYTQQSLRTPSSPVTTVEEIKVTKTRGKRTEAPGAGAIPELLKATVAQAWEEVRDQTPRALWTLRCIAVALLLMLVPRPSFLAFKTAEDRVSAMATTSLTTTEAVVATSTVPSALTTLTPTNGMALITVEDSVKPGFFSPKYPELVFASSRNGEILVTIPQDARVAWSSKSCLYIGASREEKKVDVNGSFTEKGAILRIPKKEAHGIVKLVVESKCGPRFAKVLDVYFSKGRIEEAYERTKGMVTEMRNVLPAAAQEAGRGFEFAKQSLGNVSQRLDWPQLREQIEKQVRNFAAVTVPAAHLYQKAKIAAVAATQTSYQDVKKDLKGTLSKARGFGKSISSLRHSMLDKASGVNFSGALKLAQLQLVDAQISAKLWWLKRIGQTEEYDVYAAKAKEHLKKLRSHPHSTVQNFAKSLGIPDTSQIRDGLCKGLKNRGYSFPKRCQPVS